MPACTKTKVLTANNYPLDELLIVLLQAQHVRPFWQVSRIQFKTVFAYRCVSGRKLQRPAHEVHQLQLYITRFSGAVIQEHLPLSGVREQAEASSLLWPFKLQANCSYASSSNLSGH